MRHSPLRCDGEMRPFENPANFGGKHGLTLPWRRENRLTYNTPTIPPQITSDVIRTKFRVYSVDVFQICLL